MRQPLSTAEFNKKITARKKLITMVVTFHALADTIEAFATDLENNEVVELAKKIRKEADRYGDSFSAFSDDMQAQILALGYNRAQCLPSMANVLCVEALKINNEFLNVCPFREFTQLETAKALVKCFSGYFASGSQTKKIAELVLDMRKYQFKE